MPAQPKHRDKIVRAAALLFRRIGYSAAGMNDIVALSGAPKGSVYHYFPGGKEQVAQEALIYAGGLVTQTLTALAEQSGSAAELIQTYAGMLSQWLSKSDYQDGCPVTTTLLETANSLPNLSEVGREIFRGWQAIFFSKLIHDGVAEARASRLAALAIASMEGALVLSRVERRANPIEDVAKEVGALFEMAVALNKKKAG
jgi:TetR/AcrR family transcriptional regulator, lmrAB and yxaGH operons repressor